MRAALAITIALLLATPAHATNRWGAPFQCEYLIDVVIDGIGGDGADTLLADAFAYFASESGAYFPNFETQTIAVTDPDHARALTGYYEALSNCRNGNGAHPSHPTIFERLRKDHGVGQDSVLFICGKQHLIETCSFSTAAGYGSAYSPTTFLIQAPPVIGCGDSTPPNDEGPDDPIFAQAQSWILANRPAYSLVSGSRYDFRAHQINGIYCSDTTAWWIDLRGTAGNWCDKAEALVVAVENDPVMAGKTMFRFWSDHGRHTVGENPPGCLTCADGYKRHGHPCFAPLCTGCNNNWLWIIAPGSGDIVAGTYPAVHSFEGLGTFAQMFFGFGWEGDEPPITECLAVTGVAGPNTMDTSWGRLKGLYR